MKSLIRVFSQSSIIVTNTIDSSQYKCNSLKFHLNIPLEMSKLRNYVSQFLRKEIQSEDISLLNREIKEWFVESENDLFLIYYKL